MHAQRVRASSAGSVPIVDTPQRGTRLCSSKSLLALYQYKSIGILLYTALPRACIPRLPKQVLLAFIRTRPRSRSECASHRLTPGAHPHLRRPVGRGAVLAVALHELGRKDLSVLTDERPHIGLFRGIPAPGPRVHDRQPVVPPLAHAHALEPHVARALAVESAPVLGGVRGALGQALVRSVSLSIFFHEQPLATRALEVYTRPVHLAAPHAHAHCARRLGRVARCGACRRVRHDSEPAVSLAWCFYFESCVSVLYFRTNRVLFADLVFVHVL